MLKVNLKNSSTEATMTEATDFADLKKYTTHLCIVSQQNAANYWPIALFRPKKVILFVTEKMAKKGVANQLKESIEHIGEISIEEIRVLNDCSLNEMTELFFNTLARNKEEKMVFNLTGGTKLMAFAALRAASAAEIPGFYVNIDDNSYTVFPKCDLSRGTPTKAQEFKPDLESYLSTYGFEVVVKTPAPTLTDEEANFCNVILDADSPMMDAISSMRQLEMASSSRETFQLKDFIAEKKIAGEELAALYKLKALYKTIGYLTEEDSNLKFAKNDLRYFVDGGWLEKYVGATLRTIEKITPWMNVKISTKSSVNPVRNELDCVFMLGPHLFIVECKTGLAKNRKAIDDVYKFNNLEKIGGLNTHLIFINHKKVGEAAKERAQHSGITVIDGNNLRNLKTEVLALIQSVIRQ